MNFASFDFPDYLIRNNFYLIRTHDGDLVRRVINGGVGSRAEENRPSNAMLKYSRLNSGLNACDSVLGNQYKSRLLKTSTRHLRHVFSSERYDANKKTNLKVNKESDLPDEVFELAKEGNISLQCKASNKPAGKPSGLINIHK